MEDNEDPTGEFTIRNDKYEADDNDDYNESL